MEFYPTAYWLAKRNEVKLRNQDDIISRLGLLALFGAMFPQAQLFTNSAIRQYWIYFEIETTAQALVKIQKVIQRCTLWIEQPNQRFFSQKGTEVEECSAFTPGSFPADDKESAELLVVTKLV